MDYNLIGAVGLLVAVAATALMLIQTQPKRRSRIINFRSTKKHKKIL